MVMARVLEESELDLLREVVREHKGAEITASRARALLADQRVVVVVAWLDGRPAGFCLGYHLPRIDSESTMTLLYELDVAPWARRQGAGRALVEELRAAARVAGAREVWTVANAENRAALATYEAAGV